MKVQRILLIVSTVAVLSVIAASPVIADDDVENPNYWALSGGKLNRGVYNAALGWLELPVGIKEAGAKHGVGAAATWGVLNGIGSAIQRTAVGIFEIVTFPVGIPKNFEPIIDEEIGRL
jgi:putative exosortase-associated protein (TIGR04073 family)